MQRALKDAAAAADAYWFTGLFAICFYSNAFAFLEFKQEKNKCKCLKQDFLLGDNKPQIFLFSLLVMVRMG